MSVSKYNYPPGFNRDQKKKFRRRFNALKNKRLAAKGLSTGEIILDRPIIKQNSPFPPRGRGGRFRGGNRNQRSGRGGLKSTSPSFFPSGASDVRVPVSTVSEKKDSYVLKNQERNVLLSKNFNGSSTLSALALIPLAPILDAVTCGFMDNASGGPDQESQAVAYAIVFCQNFLSAIAAQQTPDTLKIPRWLNILAEAIKSSDIPYRGSSVTYSPSTPDAINLSPTTYLLSTGGVTSNLNVTPMSGPIADNQFFQLSTTSGYTAELGAVAFAAVTKFMATRGGVMWTLVQSGAKEMTSRDASSYATLVSWKGTGTSGSGGSQVILTNPTPIIHPAFGLLGSISESNSANFIPKHTRVFGGDAIWLGWFLSHIKKPSHIKMKHPPIFKFIDYNWFAAIILQWLVNLYENASGQNTHQQFFSTNPVFPLTYYQFRILLAGVMRYVFSDTQTGVQGITPNSSNSTANSFTPFTVGTGTFSYTAYASVMLPIYAVENLRSLTFCETNSSINPGKGVKDTNNPQMVIPVLGYWESDDITGGEIPTYYNSETATSVDLFTTLTGEIMPSLHDGNVSGVFYSLNAGQNVASLISSWNETMSVFTDQIEGLVQIGSNSPVNAFRIIGMTSVQQFSSGDQFALKGLTSSDRRFSYAKQVEISNNRVKELKKNPSVPKRKILTGEFSQLTVTAVTSSVPIVASVWEEIQQVWMKPVIRLGLEGSSPQVPWTIQNVQVYADEVNVTYYAGSTVDEEVTLSYSLSTAIRNYASVMLKATTSPYSPLTVMLMSASKQTGTKKIVDLFNKDVLFKKEFLL